jgi:glycosyltransferase involved in cell wall biosynthesis
VASPERKRMEGGRRVQGLFPELPPLVSVIIAVYNGGATLERAIKSVVSQTYPHKEFIIVDGGSTDCSIELLRKYEDSIDHWISEPDKGIYDALNKGIALATGEWLYFLGADDALVDVDVFSSIFSQQYDSKFLYGDVAYGDTGKIYGGEFTKRMLTRQNICQQGIFYRVELFKTLGNFDLKYQLLADWVFNMQAFALSDAEPTHINVIVAEYSLAGVSNRVIDLAFAKDRFDLIKKYMGFSYYLLAIIFQLRDQFIANYKKYVGILLKKYSGR